MRNLADRLDIDSVRAFVALLIQTEALGVSAAQSLRTYSAEMRETRYMKAEEKAMRVPVLMTIPLVSCFLPVVIIALMLPTVIDIVRTVLPAMMHVRH
jgi:tight adherence protein C